MDIYDYLLIGMIVVVVLWLALSHAPVNEDRTEWHEDRWK